MSQVLREVSDGFALAELQSEPAFGIPLEPALAGAAQQDGSAPEQQTVAADQPAARQGAVRLTPAATPQRLVMPQRKVSVPASLLASAEPLLEPVTLPGREPKFDKLAREITDMVPV